MTSAEKLNKSHSRIGIASCLIGAGMFLVFLSSVCLYYAEFGLGYSIGHGEFAGGVRLLNILILMFIPIPVHAVCLISALVSLFFPNRKKSLPIAGLVLNLVFGIIGLFPWFYLAVGSMGRV